MRNAVLKYSLKSACYLGLVAALSLGVRETKSMEGNDHSISHPGRVRGNSHVSQATASANPEDFRGGVVSAGGTPTRSIASDGSTAQSSFGSTIAGDHREDLAASSIEGSSYQSSDLGVLVEALHAKGLRETDELISLLEVAETILGLPWNWAEDLPRVTEILESQKDFRLEFDGRWEFILSKEPIDDSWGPMFSEDKRAHTFSEFQEKMTNPELWQNVQDYIRRGILGLLKTPSHSHQDPRARSIEYAMFMDDLKTLLERAYVRREMGKGRLYGLRFPYWYNTPVARYCFWQPRAFKQREFQELHTKFTRQQEKLAKKEPLTKEDRLSLKQFWQLASLYENGGVPFYGRVGQWTPADKEKARQIYERTLKKFYNFESESLTSIREIDDCHDETLLSSMLVNLAYLYRGLPDMDLLRQRLLQKAAADQEDRLAELLLS